MAWSYHWIVAGYGNGDHRAGGLEEPDDGAARIEEPLDGVGHPLPGRRRTRGMCQRSGKAP